MKRGATRDEIIRATQELITRNGIRAVRVDEIAQTLGISKRTLYEMFADKNDLVSACLDDMSLRQQQHIIECRKRRSGNSLQKALKLMNEYIDILCKVEYSFLTDIRRKVVFAEHYDEHREFWIRELTEDLERCREEGLLLREIDARGFAEQLLGTILELGSTTRTGTASAFSARSSCAGPQPVRVSNSSTGDDSFRQDRTADRRARKRIPIRRDENPQADACGFFCAARYNPAKKYYLCNNKTRPTVHNTMTYIPANSMLRGMMMGMMCMCSRLRRV